jgi:WW domain-binding protein 4
VVGDWEVIAVAPPTPTSAEPGGFNGGVANATDLSAGAEVGEKRPADAPTDDGNLREFKMRKKTWSAGLGEIWDPEAVPIKLKSKKEAPSEGNSNVLGVFTSMPSSSTSTSNASAMPKWTTKGWSKPGERHEKTEADEMLKEEVSSGSEGALALSSATQENGTSATKTEASEPLAGLPNADAPVKTEDHAIKTEDPSITLNAAGSMFKKRKAPAATAGTRGKRAL